KTAVEKASDAEGISTNAWLIRAIARATESRPAHVIGKRLAGYAQSWKESEMHKTFDVQGTTEVEIRLNAGDIQIDPTLDGRVEIELTAHDEEAQEIVDAARVEQQGNRVLVDVPQKRGGFSFGRLFGRQGLVWR